MTKLLSLGLVAGTVSSLAACKKKEVKPTTDKKTETKTETKTKATTVAKGNVAKGTYKIGSISEDANFSTTLSKYMKSIDGTNINLSGGVPNTTAGTEYFNLPSGLFLTSAVQYTKGAATNPAKGNDDNQEEMLSDKTKFADKNLDALFVEVSDGIHNSQDVYKAIVEKKQFKNTNLFMIGEKSKSQTGASSKVFAGEKVSTASFNKYAAAYVAGFQAAVGAIKYSGSEDEYEETTVSFLIGATSESESKKKAFAFRRGVEAAAAHKDYSAFLKVKFVSKTEDSSKSSKKLYREVSEWQAKDDSKSKLYEFAASDTFSDADRRVIYISGTKAKDWRGNDGDEDGAEGTINAQYDEAANTGLVGALYNYDKPNANEVDQNLSSKTFSRGVWLVLDNAITIDNQEDDKDLVSVNLERRELKIYGTIGAEKKGTSSYVEFALKGLYMGEANYMLGKHTVFGAPLDITKITVDAWEPQDLDNKLNPWARQTNKDSESKAEARYEDSLKAALSREIIEADITKEAPWMK